MAMKNLVVCGCSFMSSSFHQYQSIKGKDWPNYEKFSQTLLSENLSNEILNRKYEHNLHFVDLYAIDKKLNYTNLAYGGASNFAIRMQIDQAISFKPNFVIVGATTSGRLEIPLGKFDHTKLIRNYSDVLEINLSNSDNGILKDYQRSFTFPSDLKFLNLNQDIETAYKHYLSLLYNNEIDDFKNYYIIQSGLRLLESLKIPYIFLPGPLRSFDWSEFKCWPNKFKQPWDFDKDYLLPGNHLPEHIHYQLLDTLNKIIRDWE